MIVRKIVLRNGNKNVMGNGARDKIKKRVRRVELKSVRMLFKSEQKSLQYFILQKKKTKNRIELSIKQFQEKIIKLTINKQNM
jgi:hypothetical protein